MSKHTPGPWFTSMDQVVAETGVPPGGGAMVARVNLGLGAEQAAANARLIAAAPRMRDLLDAVLLFYSVGWTIEKNDLWEEITGTTDATTKVLCDSIRGVLARIDGEQP